MKTAVVILNWNGAAYLRQFLPSVVRHSEGADVVVADNGSTDDSLRVLADEFPSVRCIRLDRNYGFAEGYNRAVAQLDESYETLVLLNSDVEVGQGWLAPLAEALQEPSVAVAAPKILSYSARDTFEYAGAAGGFIDWLGYPFCRGRILSVLERDEGQYDSLRDIFWAGGAAMCIRAGVFRSLGGFCGEFFAHMEEVDLCWRVQLAGLRVVVAPSSRVYHLGGGTLRKGSAQKIYLNHRNNLAMIFRCAPAGQRLAAALLRPLLDFAAAASYLMGGDTAAFRAVFRAWADFLKWHPRLVRERRRIRSAAVAESRCIYFGSVVAEYLLGRRRFGRMM